MLSNKHEVEYNTSRYIETNTYVHLCWMLNRIYPLPLIPQLSKLD
jgi:hypothetical protein